MTEVHRFELSLPLEAEVEKSRRSAEGPLRAAVGFWAVLVGGISLTIANLYGWRSWNYMHVDFVQLNAIFSFIISLMNIVLVFAISSREGKILKYVSSLALVVYTGCLAQCMCTIIAGINCGYYDVLFWEMSHSGMILLHMSLIFCLLVETTRRHGSCGRFPTQMGAHQASAESLFGNKSRCYVIPLPGEATVLRVDRGCCADTQANLEDARRIRLLFKCSSPEQNVHEFPSPRRSEDGVGASSQ